MRSLIKNLFIILFIPSILSFSGCSTKFSPVGSLITEEDQVIAKYVLSRFQEKATSISEEVISPENYVHGPESLLVGSGKGKLTSSQSQLFIETFGYMELPKWLRNNNVDKIVDKFDTSIGSFYRFHVDRPNYKIKKHLFSNFMGTGSSTYVDGEISYRRTNVIFYLHRDNDEDESKVVFVDDPLIVKVAKNKAKEGLFFIDAVKIPGLKNEGLILYQIILDSLDEIAYRFYYYDLDLKNVKTKIRWSSFSNKIR